MTLPLWKFSEFKSRQTVGIAGDFHTPVIFNYFIYIHPTVIRLLSPISVYFLVARRWHFFPKWSLSLEHIRITSQAVVPHDWHTTSLHYCDVIMTTMASLITSLTVVTQRLFRRRSKKTSKLRVTGFCVGNSPWPVNSLHKGPVTRKMFPFDDVTMLCLSMH